MFKRVILILFVFIFQGCCRYDIDDILLQREDISLTYKGEVQFVYDPLTCQLAHDDSSYEYRVYDDLLSDWFIVRCSARPDTEGQSISVDLSWTSSTRTRRENNLIFTVQKTDDKGQIWMWNKSQRIGIVIKNL